MELLGLCGLAPGRRLRPEKEKLAGTTAGREDDPGLKAFSLPLAVSAFWFWENRPWNDPQQRVYRLPSSLQMASPPFFMQRLCCFFSLPQITWKPSRGYPVTEFVSFNKNKRKCPASESTYSWNFREAGPCTEGGYQSEDQVTRVSRASAPPHTASSASASTRHESWHRNSAKQKVTERKKKGVGGIQES